MLDTETSKTSFCDSEPASQEKKNLTRGGQIGGRRHNPRRSGVRVKSSGGGDSEVGHPLGDQDALPSHALPPHHGALTG